MIAENENTAREKIVLAIEKVVQAAKELSQAESEYLGIENVNRNNTLKFICGVTPEQQTEGRADG